MSKTRNWPSRAIYILVALALVLGMAIVPAAPAIAQGTLPSMTEPEDTIAYNVKGATHKVCIDLGDFGDAQIDWWMSAGVDITPADVTVIDAGPTGNWSAESIKTKADPQNPQFLDPDVHCIEIQATKRGDIHIYVEVSDPGLVEYGYSDGKMTFHTEKKWGELAYTDLDVDASTPALEHTKSVEFGPDDTGLYYEILEDTVYGTFLQVSGEELIDGAIVHWWLLEDTTDNQNWVNDMMDYLASQDGGGLHDNYWSAHGKYKVSDLDGKQPWKYINDWVIDPLDPKYADPNIFEWVDMDPAGTGAANAIGDHPDTGDWYGWTTSVNGKAQAEFSVDIDKLVVCETYKVMFVVLVSYPEGTTPQQDPFHGENIICLEKGKKQFHRSEVPITELKTPPQLRWASEPIVLERDWGVAPYVTIEELECHADEELPPGLIIEGRFYAAIYNLEQGSKAGELVPVVDMSGFMFDLYWEGEEGEGWYEEIFLDFASMGLPMGANQVISPLGGGMYSFDLDYYDYEEGQWVYDSDTDWWTSSVSRAMLTSEAQGQADVNASLYEIGFRISVGYHYEEGSVIDHDLLEAWAIGPAAKHGFLVYFMEFEDVVLSDVTPPSSINDLEPQEDDAEVAVQVRGFVDYRNTSLMATTRVAKPIDLDGDGVADVILPAGRYVFPDDWWLLAGTKDIFWAPEFDLMDRAHNDWIDSPDDIFPYNPAVLSLGAYNTDVVTTDPPGEARFPTIGPYNPLQLWAEDRMWVAEATVDSSHAGGVRNTVVPDGIIDRWDAPMPPALVHFRILDASDPDANLSQLLKYDLEGYGYWQVDADTRVYESPFYAAEIPASPYIPAGYNWQSWGWNPDREPGNMVITMQGPYYFGTDLDVLADIDVYSDNHGIATVSIDALDQEGYVTIQAAARQPYWPKAGKHGVVRVSDDITATWGELIIEMNPWFLVDKTEVEVGETVTFTNETWGGIEPYVSALWEFGDDETSTQAVQRDETVEHAYTAPGIYTVSLTMTDQQDITRKETRLYYITVTGENGVQPPNDYVDNPAIEDGLASIADELFIVYLWQPATQSWDMYWPAAGIDDIGTLEVGKAYFVLVEAACTLQYGTRSYELYAGWNNIAWLPQ